MPKKILEVIDLKKHFRHRKGPFSVFKEKKQTVLPAVDGVSFCLKENETLGLVGHIGAFAGGNGVDDRVASGRQRRFSDGAFCGRA